MSHTLVWLFWVNTCFSCDFAIFSRHCQGELFKERHWERSNSLFNSTQRFSIDSSCDNLSRSIQFSNWLNFLPNSKWNGVSLVLAWILVQFASKIILRLGHFFGFSSVYFTSIRVKVWFVLSVVPKLWDYKI